MRTAVHFFFIMWPSNQFVFEIPGLGSHILLLGLMGPRQQRLITIGIVQELFTILIIIFLS